MDNWEPADGIVFNLNELHFNYPAKTFATALAAWLTGRGINARITGSAAQLRALSRALLSTKSFHDEIMRSDSNVARAIRLLASKNISAKRFYRLTGFKWPL